MLPPVSKDLRKCLDKVREVSKDTMQKGGFKASLMRAERLQDRDNPHDLPMGRPVEVVPTDCLPGVPDEWVGGPGSYVCPVDVQWGLYFDWTANDSMNTAVLASVKGMNPITGQKLEDVSLASYEEKCPVHDVKFKGDDRFCPKCEYEWPPQNYVCHPNTLWWDGFRQPDGSVRQFFFSEEEKRDIAALVIGKENAVPAFGFVFYEPKKERKPYHAPITSADSDYTGPAYSGYSHIVDLTPNYYVPTKFYNSSSGPAGHVGSPCSDIPRALSTNSVGDIGAEERTSGQIVTADAMSDEPEKPKARLERLNVKVSVGAGAEISQDLAKDPLSVRDWKDDPSAMIRLYFVFAEQFSDMLRHGVEPLKGEKDGYLKGLPVG